MTKTTRFFLASEIILLVTGITFERSEMPRTFLWEERGVKLTSEWSANALAILIKIVSEKSIIFYKHRVAHIPF